jgi:hypothetical protein
MRVATTIALILACAGMARAAEPDGQSGRYTMTPTVNGFLRLDTRTGAVSLCAVKDSVAECRAAADDRAALSEEIDRLSKRNAELEARVAGAGSRSPLNALPSREDMGKAMDYAEDFMRRMMRLLREDEGARRDGI